MSVAPRTFAPLLAGPGRVFVVGAVAGGACTCAGASTGAMSGAGGAIGLGSEAVLGAGPASVEIGAAEGKGRRPSELPRRRRTSPAPTRTAADTLRKRTVLPARERPGSVGTSNDMEFIGACVRRTCGSDANSPPKVGREAQSVRGKNVSGYRAKRKPFTGVRYRRKFPTPRAIGSCFLPVSIARLTTRATAAWPLAVPADPLALPCNVTLTETPERTWPLDGANQVR